ncbi:MAG TPA: ABC transporter permease, partial [Roseiarcus sp.]|nr:ABC transporter permease [Roseiarcus sp.]
MTDQTIQTMSQAERRSHRLNVLFGLTLFVVLVVIWLALSFATTTFWTSNNIANLLRQGAMIAILAIGETFTIITGGIDLSVGAIAGFISMTVALLLANHLGFASSVAGAVAISLAIGVLIGLFHAFGVTQMGLPPFIMTLATMYALRGIGFLITSGATISVDNDAFTGFSRASFLGFPWTDGTWFAMPALFWMVLVVAAPLYILLTKYAWGRYLLVIGSNKEAALLSGVNVTA